MKYSKVFASVLCIIIVFSTIVQPMQAVNANFLNQVVSNQAALTNIKPGRRDTQKYYLAQSILLPKNPDNVVYLTFDDGPDPKWTPQILEVLERYQAGATFYMIGQNVVSYPEVVREVASHGQTISVHGFNHIDLSTVGYTCFYSEVHDTEAVIMEALEGDEELIQQFGRCVRPPYGKMSDFLYANAEAMGYDVSMWNIDTKDWSGLSPEEILTRFKSALEPKKVILMHDGGLDRANTVSALELILHELLMQGYTVLPYCTQDGQAIKNSD